ncbi:DUF4424 family protein [Cohaesibacter haloalkalitolerans]|uniref:DUF4424 family protein n=1 Tax=Cohaesibacter haloalkalitolerans TaxID=1162980 RepID=UPI000E6523F6|nr:DUF4424 family protein [Cohaesibacter haloalkalitolerans]
MKIFRFSSIPSNLASLMSVAVSVLILLTGAGLAYDGPVYSPLPLTMPKLGMNKDLYVRHTSISISRELVSYEMKIENYAGADTVSTLYLPLPFISGHWDTVNNRPDLFGDRPLGVRVFVEGAEIIPSVQLRALYHQLDVSDLVKAAGLPLHPVSEKTLQLLESAPPDAVQALKDKGMVPGRWNGWGIEATYYWRQSFEAKSFTHIRIELLPAYGELVDYLMKIGEDIGLGIDMSDRKQLCLNEEEDAKAVSLFKNEKFVPNRIFELPVLRRPFAHWGSANGTWDIEVILSDGDLMAGICGVGRFEKDQTGHYRFSDDDVAYSSGLIKDPPKELQIYWLTLE